MKLRGILYLYRVRLRSRLAQELFALVGIAVGVALLFSSQVANTSLLGSVRQLTAGIVGQSRFQLVARDPRGFEERLLGEVARLGGVRAAVPVLEQRVNVIGPAGQRSVDLIGSDPRLARLGGPLLRHFTRAQLSALRAFALPRPIAQAIGAEMLQTVKLQVGEDVVPAFLGFELGEESIGALVHSPIALAPLTYVQRLTGLAGRVTRIYVQPWPGRDREVRAGLERLAAGYLNVESADSDAVLFGNAAKPTSELTGLFSAISALVGFLFAFNAMLLTMPARRRQIADLRLDGYGPWTVTKILLVDALILGAVSSLVGLVLGEELTRNLFQAVPGYLSFAFLVGSQRIVTWQSVAIALAGGVLAGCIGVLTPLPDIFSRRPLAAVERRRMGLGRVRWSVPVGVICLAASAAIVALAPQMAVLGVVCLIAALLALLPGLIGVALDLVSRLTIDLRASAPSIAVSELRSRAGRARTAGVAAIGALAVFGSVAIQGTHANLQRGLDRLFGEVSSVADVWVVPPGVQNLLTTTPLQGRSASRLERLAGVRAVGLYRAGLLNYSGRRVWVLAPPATAAYPIPANQLLSGNLALATARIRAGGWAVLSQTIADERHLRIGQSFTLPAPLPSTFRVAALTTNMGWSSGAIILNAGDYARAWKSAEPSAYDVTVEPGVSTAQVRREIQRALGPASGLIAETAQRHQERQQATSRQGLARLTQISMLMLISAILAMASAMGSMVWQRRARLAQLKLDGLSDGAVWRALLLESVLLLGVGCSAGALGLYGQLVMTRALVAVTGYPVIFSFGLLIALGSFALVLTVAVAIAAVPGYVAARVHPAVAA